MISFAEGLLRDAREGLSKEQAAIPIAEILTAAKNAAKIVKRLREFSRAGQNHEFRLPVDLNDLIQDAVALTKPIWKMASSVRRHQGVIDVQSQPGKGTTFNLLLPAAN